MAGAHGRRLADHGVGLVEAVLGLVGLHAVGAWLFTVTPDFAPTALLASEGAPAPLPLERRVIVIHFGGLRSDVLVR